MADCILALDIGTQSTRAALVAADGEILTAQQVPHEVDSPRPGWAQQRPDAWWEEACRAIRSALEASGVPASDIAAVAAGGQMHGPVGVSADGRVTTEWVQLWCDKRCQPQCERITADHDAERLARLAANPVNPAWAGIKVRWYRDEQRSAYDAARWFLVPKDFINFRLTGVAATDPSEASGSFLQDAISGAYSPELAEAVGVDVGRFAPVRASHEVIGRVTAEAGAETGLLAGTPVVAGGGDFPVSMLGFGIVGPGLAADVTGTSSLLASHTGSPIVHPSIQNLRHVAGGWVPFTILDCGGLSMKWIRDLVSSARGEDIPYEELVDLAARTAAGSNGLVFYPYLLGERRSENTMARGAFLALALDHRAGHVVRAAMEGVAYAMGRDVGILRDRGVPVDRILCVGGGTRNRLWNEIKASVIGVPLELSREPEAGLRGAALLGAAGAGLIEDAAATARSRREPGDVVEPRPELASTYREGQAEFCRIYDHLLGFWSDAARDG